MAKKERFGKFVLLEELGSSGLGIEYRAAKLASGGALERLVLLVRLGPALSGNSGFTGALLEQTKAASLLHGPHILKLIAIGRVESAYYVAYEHLEGKSLKAVLERSRRDAFPFSPDHALAIASKVCAALEYAHGKQDAHGRHVHGLLTPDAVFVTHDGEVKLRGFGTWDAGALRAGAIAADERGYLAPEQAASGVAKPQADVYGAGALLFEMLTGQPLQGDPAAGVKEARLAAGVEGEALPRPMAEILAGALAAEPAARFGEMAEMRKAVDTLLYSGSFNPTTFNLAFFIHSLFREEIERDASNVAQERAASYAEYLVEETPRAAPPPMAPRPATARAAPAATVAPAASAAAPVALAPAATPAPAIQAAPPVPMPAPVAPPAPAPPEPEPPVLRVERPREPFPVIEAEALPTPGPLPARHSSVSPVPPPKLEPKRRPPLPLVPIAAVLVTAGGVAAWYFVAGPGAGRALPPPTTLSAETIATQARVRELEAKLQRFEQEKAQAETKAAEEAKQKLEAQAAARGQAVDPGALRKAQEDARVRAQREQDRKQQEEKRLLEEEQRAAEARLAEERRRAAAAAAAATPPPTLAAAPPPTTLPPATPPPTTAPPASAPPATLPAAPPSAPLPRPGALVNISEVGVIPPVLDRGAPLVYPPIARQQRTEGTVELSVLIDEKGTVAEVKVIKGTTGIGLNQAAIDNVKRRKYRPATKDGVPVRVYVSVIVKFEIPR